MKVGVCCLSRPTTPPPTQPINVCPSNSQCVPEDFCFGEFLDDKTKFSPYSIGGSWSRCKLIDGKPGVCCKEAPHEVANTCGVSRYAHEGNNANTRFYPPSLEKQEADFGEMPWQAIIFYTNNTFRCGASLISDRHLLTAAHCVLNVRPGDIRIRVGEWQVNAFNEPLPYQDVDVKLISIHPGYKATSQWHDIAIIEMNQKLNFQYNINNICLPFAGITFPPHKRCYVSGWGKNKFDGSYQNILKKVDVPLISHEECEEKLRKTRLGTYFQLHESFLCAGGELGKDACVGDGGGPLICFNDAFQSYVQVGITSWGIGCGQKDVPGVYTKVSLFTSWITGITGLGLSGVSGFYGK